MRILTIWLLVITLGLTGWATQASQLEIIVSAPVLPGVDTAVRYSSHPQHYQQQPVLVIHAPAYHQHDWNRYCSHYRACGSPVRFVTTYPVQEHRHWQAPVYEVHEHRHYHHKKPKKQHRHHHHCRH